MKMPIALMTLCLVPVYGGAAIRFHRWLWLQEWLTLPTQAR